MDSPSMPNTEPTIPTDSIPPLPSERSPWQRPLRDVLRTVWKQGGSIQQHLGLSAGTLFYTFSALSLAYGLTQIIGPPLAKSFALTEILPCVGVIKLYELSLVAILLIGVHWRGILNDAVFLVILMGLFLVASAMTLSVVAPSGLNTCLAIGVFCLILAGLKLVVLRYALGVPLRLLSMVGLVLLLAWNFLGSSLMARPLMAMASPDELRRSQWTWGWLIILGGLALTWIDALHTSYEVENDRQPRPPFLRQPAMAWLFVLVLWGATGFHQYGLAYMLAIDYELGDFLPWSGAGILLLLEWIRSLHKPLGKLEPTLLLLPLLGTLWAMSCGNTTVPEQMREELLLVPPTFLAVFGLAVLVLSLIHDRPTWIYITGLYGLGALLTLSSSHRFNWALAGGGLVLALLVLGLYLRRPAFCFLSICGLALSLTRIPGWTDWATNYGLTGAGLLAGFVGLGTLGLALGFGVRTPRWMTALSTLGMAVCIHDFLPATLRLVDLMMLAYVMVVFVMLVLRTQQTRASLPLWLPLGPRGYLLIVGMSSWAYVVLSFFLLFVGAGFSLFRQHRKG